MLIKWTFEMLSQFFSAAVYRTYMIVKSDLWSLPSTSSKFWMRETATLYISSEIQGSSWGLKCTWHTHKHLCSMCLLQHAMHLTYALYLPYIYSSRQDGFEVIQVKLFNGVRGSFHLKHIRWIHLIADRGSKVLSKLRTIYGGGHENDLEDEERMIQTHNILRVKLYKTTEKQLWAFLPQNYTFE